MLHNVSVTQMSPRIKGHISYTYSAGADGETGSLVRRNSQRNHHKLEGIVRNKQFMAWASPNPSLQCAPAAREVGGAR
jgi:hypothetical protein